MITISPFAKLNSICRRKSIRRDASHRLQLESLEARQLLATVTVNTDLGLPGELRTVAAAATPGETIDFALSAGNENIVLSQGPLVIDVDLTIDGDNTAGSGTNVTLTGNGTARVVTVDNGDNTINTLAAEMRNLTITGGRAVQGGGLFNAEQLTLNNVTVSGNTAQQTSVSLDTFGGGVLNNGALTLQSSNVSQNRAQFAAGSSRDAFGGGIASRGVGSELTLINSIVSSNEAIRGSGGGIFSQQGPLTLNDSSVSDNRAGLDTATYGSYQDYHYGGGIAVYSLGTGGTVAMNVTITDSMVSGNVLSNDGITGLVFPYGGGLFAKGQGTVRIGNSTISGNSATGNNLGGTVLSRGGGIFLYGHDNGLLEVDIQGTMIDNNFSYNQGGGIAIRGGNTSNRGPVNATIDGSSISNNTAGVPGRGQGGAIFNWALNGTTSGLSDLTITNSTLSGNSTVGGSGGVIRNSHGARTYFDNCTFANNTAYNNGGVALNVGYGLASGQLPPTMVFSNSTLSGNQALSGNGGAIYSYDGNLEIFQSTLSGNTAVQGIGGALYMATAYAYVGTPNETSSTLERSTLTLNDAYYGGGGIAVNPYHSSTWTNSIISGNTSTPGSEELYLSTNTSITYAYTMIGGNALLGPLADNGGPTLTHLPLPGSPVIDAANPTATGVADQRGFEPRVVGAAMDMGSVEVGATGSLPCDLDGDGDCDIDDLDLLCADVFAGNRPLSDVDQWLIDASPFPNPYLPGDADLNGIVDGNDFITWNSFKFTASGGLWSRGDFNCDGLTDGQDFIIWNLNKFQNSLVLRGTPPLSSTNDSAEVTRPSMNQAGPTQAEGEAARLGAVIPRSDNLNSGSLRRVDAVFARFARQSDNRERPASDGIMRGVQPGSLVVAISSLRPR